jgi:hypothetical protein
MKNIACKIKNSIFFQSPKISHIPLAVRLDNVVGVADDHRDHQSAEGVRRCHHLEFIMNI